ncbi:MAG: thioredoxin family protein [Victivallaceae bacterium]|jgi:thioredoxin 1
MNYLKSLLICMMATAGWICMAQCGCSEAAAAEDSSTTAGKDAPAVKARLPKLLDLGAKKCIPCKMMAPILEELTKEYAGVMEVEFIDVWQKENAEKAQKYNIQSIPTQIMFDADGKELWRHEGFISREDIFKKWKELGYDFEKLKNEKAADKK